MSKGRMKLMLTATMLLLSIVLLAGASLAWFTLSTAPEVSGMQVTLFTDRALLVSVDGTNFTQSINLSELFQYYAPLKPVSTADGVNWFIPTYNDQTGLLKPVSQFKLDTSLEHGNVLIYKEQANGSYTIMTGADLMTAENKGYYVYCDFWLATELVEGCQVTLSAPDLNKNNLETWEKNENHEHGAKYGSYALAMYEKKDDNSDIYQIDNNAQTALRVGFLIDQDLPTQRFVIYEPNADQRSSLIDKPLENGTYTNYIHGFDLIKNPNFGVTGDPTSDQRFLNYVPNSYIPTKPVGYTTDADGNTIVSTVDISPQNLIVQLAGQWDLDDVRTRILGGSTPNSNDIEYFGKFVQSTAEVTAADNLNSNGYHPFDDQDDLVTMGLASSSMIVTLEGRDEETGIKPKKIRMFIWIEGQDPDCWNDIANGSFVVNLEFAAQTPSPTP